MTKSKFCDMVSLLVRRKTMYRISEFASMIGQSQSKLRFYEKYGLFEVKKAKNGYRCYTQEDGFRFNAFRSLLQYGFTVEQTVRMLDMPYEDPAFLQILQMQEQDLEQQITLLKNRLERLRNLSTLIQGEGLGDFRVTDEKDYLYYLASIGNNYHISMENREMIAALVEIIPITRYMRVIPRADFLGKKKLLTPNYGIGLFSGDLPAGMKLDPKNLERAPLGKCVCFYRRMTREKSQRYSSFRELEDWLIDHGYRLRSDILLFPHFLNLDGKGEDLEYLIVPVE